MEKLYLCNKCGENKPSDNFHKNSRKFKNPKNGRDGLSTICKKCHNKNQVKNRKNNIERYNNYSREWNLKNKERRRELALKFSKTPKGIYIKLKKRGNCFISQKEFIEWYNIQERKCYYCGVDEKLAQKSKNPLNVRLNIDRKDNDKGYKLGNICLACGWCNRVKTDLLTEEEMKYVGKNFILKKYNKFNT